MKQLISLQRNEEYRLFTVWFFLEDYSITITPALHALWRRMPVGNTPGAGIARKKKMDADSGNYLWKTGELVPAV